MAPKSIHFTRAYSSMMIIFPSIINILANTLKIIEIRIAIIGSRSKKRVFDRASFFFEKKNRRVFSLSHLLEIGDRRSAIKKNHATASTRQRFDHSESNKIFLISHFEQ